MVLLTMTPVLVAAVDQYQAVRSKEEEYATTSATEPDLSSPAVGKPISHGQIMDISRHLRNHASSSQDSTAPSYNLDVLLRGSHVYIAPAQPKAEPVRPTTLAGSGYTDISYRRHRNTKSSWLVYGVTKKRVHMIGCPTHLCHSVILSQ